MAAETLGTEKNVGREGDGDTEDREKEKMPGAEGRSWGGLRSFCP